MSGRPRRPKSPRGRSKSSWRSICGLPSPRPAKRATGRRRERGDGRCCCCASAEPEGPSNGRSGRGRATRCRLLDWLKSLEGESLEGLRRRLRRLGLRSRLRLGLRPRLLLRLLLLESLE
jgi:hypothetical protein